VTSLPWMMSSCLRRSRRGWRQGMRSSS
jgi:hypothetical protein